MFALCANDFQISLVHCFFPPTTSLDPTARVRGMEEKRFCFSTCGASPGAAENSFFCLRRDAVDVDFRTKGVHPLSRRAVLERESVFLFSLLGIFVCQSEQSRCRPGHVEGSMLAAGHVMPNNYIFVCAPAHTLPTSNSREKT